MFQSFVPFAFGGASFLSILAIAIDSYYTIVRRRRFSDKEVWFIVSGAWLVSFGLFVVGCFFGDAPTYINKVVCEINFLTRNPINIAVLWLAVVCFAVGFVLVVIICKKIDL